MTSVTSDAKSSDIWLKSSSLLSMPLSCDSLSLSMDSMPPELRGDPLVLRRTLPLDLCVVEEQQEYRFYGLEQDGALRPGGPVNLVSRRTVGLLLNYFCVGALYGGIYTASMPYLSKYLQLEQYQIQAASMVVNTAWNCKALGGFLTDSVRICGYRRKPYMIIGWLLCIGCMLFLGASETPAAGNKQVAWKYMLFTSLGTFGMCLANTAADAMVVEIAQREPLLTRGRTQVNVFAARITGVTIMSLFVTGSLDQSVYEGSRSWSLSVNQVMLVLAACAMISLISSIWLCHEDPKVQTVPVLAFANVVSCSTAPQRNQPNTSPLDPSPGVHDRFQLVWKLVQSRAMWRLLMFELVSGFCVTIDSSAAQAIEVNWIDAQSWPNTVARAVWSLAYVGGLFVTQQFLLRSDWQHLYCVSTLWYVLIDVITVVCSVFDIVRNQTFWLNMRVLSAPVMAIRFLVMVFPIVELAPRGIEGTTHGLVITFRNLAIPFGTAVYKMIGSHFAVSAEDLRRDSRSTRLQVFYTYIVAWTFQLTILAFIRLLPRQKLEVQQMRYYGGYSFSGGWLVAIALFGGLTYVGSANIMSLFERTACFRMAGGSGCEG
uniref:Transmembrane protein n=1 Tax=Hyaloperonospora arabidopsidis (strain Emoy2) TaxID=559515 RepID=M4B538_HYAAE